MPYDYMPSDIVPPLHVMLLNIADCEVDCTLQVEVRDHWHPGGGCEASTPHVVMAAHSPSPTDGKMLPKALQEQNHQ